MPAYTTTAKQWLSEPGYTDKKWTIKMIVPRLTHLTNLSLSQITPTDHVP